MNRIARLMGLAALVLVTSSGLTYAQPTDAEVPAAREVAEGDLPSGWDVLDREIEAIGGEERYLKIKNFVATGIFSMPAMGINGPIVRTELAPDKLHMLIQFGGMGEMQQATDGTVAWAIPPGGDTPQKLEGEDGQQMIERAQFYNRVHPRKLYESAKVTGTESVNGEPCYRVSLVTKEGTNSLSYYNIESGLMVKSMARSTPEAETFDTVVEFSDFRDIDGIVHAFVMKQSVQGNEFTITFESIEHDAEIDQSIFSMPKPQIPEGEI